MAAVLRSWMGSRHSVRAQASTPARPGSGPERAVPVTAERMPGTLTPRKSRSLLRYLLACRARSASASGSIAAITAAAAVSASKDGLLTGPLLTAGPLLTGPRYRAGDGRLGACHGR